MKTAQEVANELDLTRTEVYNLLRKKRFSPLVKKNGGQVAISNELFKLLEEEIKNKRNNIKQQENKNIDIKQEDKSLEEKNTIVDVKTEENTDFTSTIGIFSFGNAPFPTIVSLSIDLYSASKSLLKSSSILIRIKTS